MPGLFVVASERLISRNKVDFVIEKLQHRKWFKVDCYDAIPEKVYIGRVSNGILNTEQPKSSDDGRFVAFIEGEVYNAQEIWISLGREAEKINNDAHLVLALNQTGPMIDWIHRCQGSFTILIWDSREKLLTIGNDRYGHRPHYYTFIENFFLFGSEVKFLLYFLSGSPDLDIRSIVDYFAFQSILDDRTFFKNIKVMPYATILTVQTEKIAVQETRYWNFDKLQINHSIGFKDAVEKASELFQKAVDLQSGGHYRFGLTLSGGLDSRMILGSLKRYVPEIHAFTYGLKNSRDIAYATRMCKIVGAKHHIFILDSGRWIKDIAEDYIKLTEGFQGIFHAHAYHKVPALRDYIDINIHGFAGDLIMGGSRLIKDVQKDDWLSLSRSIYKYSLKQGIGFTSDYELRQLFTDSIWEHPDRTPAWESFEKSIQSFMPFEFDNVSDFFHLTHRVRKQLIHILVANRPYQDDRFPFYDYDLFDFLYSLPVQCREKRKIQAEVLDKLSPKLASIPDSLGKVMYTSQRIPRVVERTKRGLILFGEKLSGGLIKDKTREYQEYSKWLRTDLGDWARGILLDKRTLERGLFSPDFINSILDEHLNGKEDCLWKIGQLITFEMSLRLLID